MDIKKIVTPKSYYIQERDYLYNNWIESFWRELFQNSTDAGAKNIQIQLYKADGKGSFGEFPAVNDVIRVIFKDDGCGMSEDVIDNVFFKPGQSTKRGDGTSTGGYGRARLMTAYAQVRYSIATGDRAIEGDGSEYVHSHYSKMIQDLQDKADKILAEHGAEDIRYSTCLGEIASLRTIFNNGFVEGVRFEVDINPNENIAATWKNPTIESLTDSLNSYLSMSQIKAHVTINGEVNENRLLKGPLKRTLTANVGEKDVQFATVHTSKGAKAGYKGKMIVRVDGATMFTNDISTDVQVIVELEKSLSREIMTANRDALREPYASAFELLKNEIAVDATSALDKDDKSSRIIEGTLGRMKALPQFKEIDYENLHESVVPNSAFKETKVASLSEIETNGYAGIPFDVLHHFFRSVYRYESFLNNKEYIELRDKINSAIRSRHGAAMVKNAIAVMTEDEKVFILSYLGSMIQKNEAKKQEELERKLQGLHDIQIFEDGKVSGKIRAAMNRHDPKKWNPKTGSGLRARSTLAAWTVMCHEAISAMTKHAPNVIGEEGLDWITGFVYSEPKESHRLGRYEQHHVKMAMHHRDEKNTHALLINPIDSDGNWKYNPKDPADLHEMAILAAHEVAHIQTSWHNEDFANLMTKIATKMDFKAATKLAKQSIANISDIYKSSKIISEPMDNEGGIRPTEKLIASGFPATVISAGIMASPENAKIDSDILRATDGSIIKNADGTTTYDIDQIRTIEDTINNSHNRNKSLEEEDDDKNDFKP